MKKLARQKVLAVILVAPLALITICAVLFLAFTYHIRTSSQSNIERFKTSYTDAQQFFNNVGRAEFSIKAEKPCTVTVTVDQRGVVILAPIDSHIYFPEANFFSFYGATDDSHFVPKRLP